MKPAISSGHLLVWADPTAIEFCTPASRWTDVNQHQGQREHPHAHFDRGYFNEGTRRGSFLDGNWDNATLRFDQLLEYIAIRDHINGRVPWAESEFAGRGHRWIRSGAQTRGFSDPDEFLTTRSQQVDQLIHSIQEHGVHPAGGPGAALVVDDDISVNVARDGRLLFNNRGHHRLSIAKILQVPFIPVQVIVRHCAVRAWRGRPWRSSSCRASRELRIVIRPGSGGGS